MKIFFISADARWQKYRLDILTKLAIEYHLKVEILTVNPVKKEFLNQHIVKYKIFRDWIDNYRYNFFPASLLYILKNKPNVVIGINNVKNITEYLCLILCKILRIKFIWWTHAYDHVPSNNRILAKLKVLYSLSFLKFADSIITFSEKGRIFLVDKGIDKQKIFHAPNTLNTDLLNDHYLKMENTGRNIICKQLGIDSKNRYVLFSSRLTKHKRTNYVIEIIEKLHKEVPYINLIIIGDGDEFDEIKKLIKEREIYYIKLLGAIYDEEVLAKWFYISDVFFMPSYIGLSIVHSFCFGVPVVTENSENHGPEFQYIINNYNSLVGPFGNDESSVRNLKSIVQNAEYRNLLSCNARKTIELKANVKQMTYGIWQAINN